MTKYRIVLEDISLTNRSARPNATLHVVVCLSYRRPMHRGSKGHYLLLMECVERQTIDGVDMELRSPLVRSKSDWKEVLEYAERFSASRLKKLAEICRVTLASKIEEYLSYNLYYRATVAAPE
ncbi:MAG: hypothetical protein E6R03_06805 [Hyphomicrobiaceae bacterium]|nr:MAG: hypothetical protein E6R03_06805 [Hyphomicrobiaceae bacterium]